MIFCNFYMHKGTFYDNPVRSLLICKVFTYTIRMCFYDNHVRSATFFEITTENTVEICQKYEVYHEIYKMQLGESTITCNCNCSQNRTALVYICAQLQCIY